MRIYPGRLNSLSSIEADGNPLQIRLRRPRPTLEVACAEFGMHAHANHISRNRSQPMPRVRTTHLARLPRSKPVVGPIFARERGELLEEASIRSRVSAASTDSQRPRRRPNRFACAAPCG
jgi:hypothetical protein